ncbi:MAG: hypothetical protein KAI66_20880, partial [Lentisphaeria bacterium]|nr:hypothetical protein [Lentisphaeria bacterium]
DLLRRLGSDWPNRDMDAFLKWFGTVKSDSDQEIVVKAAAQALSWRDPTKAVAFYDILPKGADKYGLASSLLRGWVRTDVESALDWFDTLPVEAQRTAMRGAGMVSALAKKDPERGLEFALEFESGALRSQALGEALGGWADSDLEAAVKWVRDEAGDEDLVSAVNAVMRKLAIEDPPRAATFALMLSEEERGKADASAAANWARSDYRAMLEWATAQTDREIGPYVKAGIAKWAAQDPAAAATALSTMPESNGTQSATQSVVRQWSRTDPDQAADWIVSFPEGSMRDTSVSTLVRNWTESNEEQAETFVSGLQDPHTRDKAALAFIQSIAKYDREKATTWLETIADEDIRKQADRYLK